MAKNTSRDAARPNFVRHGKLRRSSTWGNMSRILLTTVIVVVLSGAATVAYALLGLWSSRDTVALHTAGAEAVKMGTHKLDGELTILLVGSDSRAGQEYDDGEEGELNDVNLLLHVSADHQNATVVSFPRDLMVPIPSCPGPNGEEGYYPAMSEQQLNSTLAEGGLSCVALTIEELTGMPIPYAGLITFDGVVGISNAIGGVDVCLTQPIWDPATGLALPAGDVTLQGWDALQFLRTRYGVGDGGDTSRINNQQVFMSSLVRQLKSADTLSDPVKLYSLAKAGVENTQLSDNMASVDFLQAVASTVKDIDLDRVNFVQYPATAHPYQEGRLTPDYASAKTLFDVIESGQPFNVSGVGEGVEVKDKSSNDGTTEAAAEPQIDPETGLPIDPATGWPIDPETGWPINPDTGLPTEPTTPAPDPNAPVTLPENITGLQASTSACSMGRTIY